MDEGLRHDKTVFVANRTQDWEFRRDVSIIPPSLRPNPGKKADQMFVFVVTNFAAMTGNHAPRLLQ